MTVNVIIKKKESRKSNEYTYIATTGKVGIIFSSARAHANITIAFKLMRLFRVVCLRRVAGARRPAIFHQITFSLSAGVSPVPRVMLDFSTSYAARRINVTAYRLNQSEFARALLLAKDRILRVTLR